MTVHTNHMPPRTTDGDRGLAAARARRTRRTSARRPGGYWLLLVAALGLGLMTEVHHASACGNAMVLSGDETAQTLSQAERQLAAGRADRAFVSALTVFWSLEEAVGLTEDGYDESGDRPSERAEQRSNRRKAALSARAKLVMAVAMVRLNGATTFEPHHAPRVSRLRAVRHALLSSPTDAERQASLTWALTALTDMQPADGDDPVQMAHYAEALARFPDHRAQALQLLHDLATRDLMPDAWAYRTLAELLRGTDDTASAEAAAHCRERAGRHASRICSESP